MATHGYGYVYMRQGLGKDLFAVIAHEIGHALGMYHNHNCKSGAPDCVHAANLEQSETGISMSDTDFWDGTSLMWRSASKDRMHIGAFLWDLVNAETSSFDPAQLIYVSGSGQSGPINSELPGPFVVRVANKEGVGIAGMTVNFTVQAGDNEGILSSPSAITNDQGIASVRFTPKTEYGKQVTAQCPLVDQTVTFTATGTAPNP